MQFTLVFTQEASDTLAYLDANDEKKAEKVRKTLGLMQTNLRNPGLNTHEYHSLKGPNGEKVFEAYVENRTPAAYRVFWCYGPERGFITVLAITPHP